jgi:hypothetical protein
VQRSPANGRVVSFTLKPQQRPGWLPVLSKAFGLYFEVPDNAGLLQRSSLRADIQLRKRSRQAGGRSVTPMLDAAA